MPEVEGGQVLPPSVESCRDADTRKTDTIEQAIERAATNAGNKGDEAVPTAIELANLMRQLPRRRVAGGNTTDQKRGPPVSGGPQQAANSRDYAFT